MFRGLLVIQVIVIKITSVAVFAIGTFLDAKSVIQNLRQGCFRGKFQKYSEEPSSIFKILSEI